MHTTSGLILDVYDDVDGGVLRALYPSPDQIPAQVKQASVVTGEFRESLPDDLFGLVLLNNGEKLRKFACVDPGNTILSVEYFLKTAHKLPAEAQKTGAENLKVACSWYELPVPEELEKMAGGLGTALTLATAPAVLSGTAHSIRNNLAANRAYTDAGHSLVTPQMRNDLLSKAAEVSGTPLAPAQAPGILGTAPKPLAVVQKTAAAGHLNPPATNDQSVPGKQPTSAPQATAMRPTVDISNKEPPHLLKEKKANAFALPGQARYPLDSYTQVKEASRYFDTYSTLMPPDVRREYAVNLVKRANAIAVGVSDLARKTGAEDFAPDEELKVAFDARRIEVQHDTELLDLLGQVEKVARYRMWKEAEVTTPVVMTAAMAAAMLSEFDKIASITHLYDRAIPDPYYSIYGFEKDADADFTEVIGNETVTAADLKRLARIGALSVKTTFGGDFQEEFLKDPVGIFKSMPLDQKKMMMRMANSTQPGTERTFY